jgi:hypothetical protein
MSFSSVIQMVSAYKFEQFSESSFYEKESVLHWTHETESFYKTNAFNKLFFTLTNV